MDFNFLTTSASGYPHVNTIGTLHSVPPPTPTIHRVSMGARVGYKWATRKEGEAARNSNIALRYLPQVSSPGLPYYG